jgi:predicted aspartyl protease
VINGIIKNGRATVNVMFRLPNKPDFTIEFVIDTGFTGDLFKRKLTQIRGFQTHPNRSV